MDELISEQKIQQLLASAERWLLENVLVLDTLIQAVIIVLTFAAARFIGKRAAARLRALELRWPALRRPVDICATLATPLLWFLLLWTAIPATAAAGTASHLLSIAASILAAWLVIRLVSIILGESPWTRLVAWVAWTLATLNILNLLEPTIELLDARAIQLGGLRLSAFVVIKTMIALALLLWAATSLGELLERRVRGSVSLSPSLKVLITKLLRISLIAIAIIIAIQSVGLDLTVLTVFGGALGLGVGFGLQKVIANLVSGVILLLDKSIKPGDVIAVNGTYGWVNTLGGRYVSVITRDGVEHLIPNETLITERVENWTYSDSNVRLKVPVGVHYNSDLHQAIALCVQAAAETPRILKDPDPRCLLIGFGDNSVDLEIRMWISDASQGVANVKSEVLLKVWDKFKEHKIEIPYPQRDLHLRSGLPEHLLG